MNNVVKKQYGFTLLELVVVVAVLGLIASMATEFVVYETNQQRYELTKERRNSIRTALANYYADCGEFPDHLNWLLVKSNLDASKCDSTSAGNDKWAGPYILDVDFEYGIPVYRDGWGNASGAITSSAAVAADMDFGWSYTPDNSVSPPTVELSTLGLNGRPGETSSVSSQEYKFEVDEGSGYTLLTAPSNTHYYLLSVASGAGVSILSCRTGLTPSAASVAMSNCM